MKYLLLVVGVLVAGGSVAAAPPNIVVILTDDQGWGDLSLHGNTDLRPPHIDALATSGARFRHFYVQPVCSPTRAEFLTGRYHPRGGVRDVSRGGERLNLGEKTVANCFAAAGYATGAFGKWHNGTQYPYHPNGRGFQEYYGFTAGHWGDYFSPPLDHNGHAIRGTGFLADDLTDHAISFIDSHKDRPFFCYLAFNTPHSPMQVPDAYWDRFKNAALKLGPTPPHKQNLAHARAALAMCENLDANIGRLVKAIGERKLDGQTIIVFFCDNGPNGWRWNGGMKGRKGSTDEGGVRSPLFIKWPGHIAPGTEITPIAGAIDLLPTLTDLTGIRRVGTRPLDGVSFAASLRGEKREPSDRVLVQHWNNKVSVRSQKYRLDTAGKLYDLDADPGQTTDITAKQPQVAKRLKAAAATWRKDVLAGIAGKDDRPFTVGYPQFPVTRLPARDGVPHGTVTRSARAPNCSYFTHWTRPDDRITWDVEVATAGRYRVEVLYTCAKENLGTTIEFRLGDARLTRRVDVAHDPAPYGDNHDRAPRVGESLMKDFKPLSLGEATLSRGRRSLILRAPEIPGKQAIEVRGVTLTLLKSD
jgi:arylsulfatase A-like enzyme